VSGRAVPISPLPKAVDGNYWDDASLAGGRWLSVAFDRRIVLRVGQTYALRVIAGADTRYVAIPLREQDATRTRWSSRAFRDGVGQKTSNGTKWQPMYAYGPTDLQFFLR